MVPQQRKSRSRTRRGRSHQGLRAFQAVTCPNCGTAKRPHAMCRECGYVRPGLLIDVSKEG